MLRLRVKIERVDKKCSIETVAIANSGFVSFEPEILLPYSLVLELRLDEIVRPEISTRILADGSELRLVRYRQAVYVYVIDEDRVEGPVLANVLTVPTARHVLLNDKLLSRLRIVILDAGEGLWCFRDEIGRKERRSV